MLFTGVDGSKLRGPLFTGVGKLIWDRVTYGYEDGRSVPHDNSEYIAKYRVGGTLVVSAGAPGTGRIVYRITRIDDAGIWGVVELNTMRELTPSEVY